MRDERTLTWPLFAFGGVSNHTTTQQAGWFNRTYTLYNDDSCQDPKISYTEVGTLNTGGIANTGEESYAFQRWAGATEVTPYGDYTTTMNLQCPCGGSWQPGQTRRLTQCRSADGQQATCIQPGWCVNTPPNSALVVL